MQRWDKSILLIIATIAILPVFAQVSNLRNKKIPATGIIQLDTVSIVPRTVIVVNYDTSYFTIDAINAILKWKKLIAEDSVIISYRVFPTRLNAVARRFTYDSVLNNFI